MKTPMPLVALWEYESQENESHVLLLPGCPFDSSDFYADLDENPDAGHHIIALAITALGKPKPDMQDFKDLFRIESSRTNSTISITN